MVLLFYQLLAHGRWFSQGTRASSTTKTGRHEIAEILLKVTLNIKNQSINQIVSRSMNIFLDKNDFQRENRSYFAKRVDSISKINKGPYSIHEEWFCYLLSTLNVS